jgi:hypothetical protein
VDFDRLVHPATPSDQPQSPPRGQCIGADDAVSRNSRPALAGLATASAGCSLQICGHGKKFRGFSFPKTR